MTGRRRTPPRSVASSILPLAIFAATLRSHAQNLVVNGDFDEGSTPAGWFNFCVAGSRDVLGWRVTGASIDHIGTYWAPATGIASIDLNGTNAGGLTQDVPTVPGLLYEVRFSLAANPDCGSFLKTMVVRAGEIESPVFTASQDGASRGDMRWSTRMWHFVASEPTTRIEFLSTTPDSPCGPALDAVAVETCVGGVTPSLITACRGIPTAVEVEPGGDAPFTYEWQIEDDSMTGGWRTLTDGPIFVDGVEWGAAASTTSARVELNTDPVGSVSEPQIRIRAVVSNACASSPSSPTAISICQCLDCPADFNQDGGIDGSDTSAFFVAWEAGVCDADVNVDGGVDSGDVTTFFIAWEAGGC